MMRIATSANCFKSLFFQTFPSRNFPRYSSMGALNSDTPNIENSKVIPNKPFNARNNSASSEYWYALYGLSEHSNRKDALSLFPNNQTPVQLESILDFYRTPTGNWLVKFNNQINLAEFKSNLSQQTVYPVTIKLIDRNTLTSFSTAVNFRASIINNCTIIIRRLPVNIEVDHLINIFEEYSLAEDNPILIIRKTGSYVEAYVNFSNPLEAKRAILEKCNILIEGKRVNMSLFDI